MTVRNRPILVTGSHRSGSTWVGRMLALAENCFYVHEPFNPALRPEFGFEKIPVEHWFEYVAAHNAAHFVSSMQAVVSGQYSLIKDRRLWQPRKCKNALRSWIRYWVIRQNKYRAILKDPIALFSTEWLTQHFDMNVVVLIRHPAAFVSSIRRLNWPINISKELLTQTALVDRYLYDYVDEMAASRVDDDLINQAALMWKLMHHVIRCFEQEHPEWLYYKHEDLSVDPVAGFREMYDLLGLELTGEIETTITEHTGTQNPKQIAVTGSEVKVTNSIKVDSAHNVTSWHDRLTEEEIDRIRTCVESVSSHYYSDSSWQL